MNPLAEVRRAAVAKRRAEQRYKAAIVAAVEELEAGQSHWGAYALVAQAAGVSRQAVRQLVRHERVTPPTR